MTLYSQKNEELSNKKELQHKIDQNVERKSFYRKTSVLLHNN